MKVSSCGPISYTVPCFTEKNCEIFNDIVRFEFLTVVSMMTIFCWDVMPYFCMAVWPNLGFGCLVLRFLDHIQLDTHAQRDSSESVISLLQIPLPT
jgi:hypothetical protein